MTNKTFLVVFKDPNKGPLRVTGKGRQSVAMKVAGCRVIKAISERGIESIREIKTA